MIVGRTRQMTTSRLLKEASGWLVSAVERTYLLTERPAPGRRAKVTNVEILDRRQVEQIAEKHFARGIVTASADERSSAEAAGVICREWGRPEAALLAQAWLRADDKELKGAFMDTKSVAVLIGVAAAAAVLALVLLARRNTSVTVHGREFRVSTDFSALQRVRDQGGAAADVTRYILDSERSPWDFRLEPAVGRLSASDKRTLLSALAAINAGVEVISPAPGAAFVPEQMNSARVVKDGSAWTVAAAPPAAKVGFLLHGRTVVPAEVDACTADWWCLALADPACPVASAVRADPDQYVGLDAEYASCWSVVQGFSAFTDLRAEFNESTLNSWSERLRERLSLWYPASSGRLPVTFGSAGDRYDASVMKPTDAAPEADARVVAVEERDGLPQLGLGCVGAPPLLYAVVRVEEG